jgi:UDP-glucose 4-epimerase
VRWIGTADGAPRPDDLAGCSALVHLAGRAHTRVAVADGRDLFDEANRALALRTAAAARQAGVRRFVFVSTLGVHGNWSAAPVTADSPPQLDTPYARSKWAAEQELRELCAGGAMQLCIVRPPMVYGPGCPGNFGRLVRLVQRGIPLPFGSLRGTRSFVQVDNLAAFLQRCCAQDAPAGTFVVADGSDWSLPELVRAIAAALHRPARLLPFPPALLRLAAAAAGLRREMDSLTRPMPVDARDAWRAFGWTPPVDPGPALRDAAASHAR